MSKELQTISQTLIDELQVPESVLQQLQPTQLGWLKLEKLKRTTFEALQKQELEVQLIVSSALADKELPVIQDKLKDVKLVAATAKEQRLRFTNMLNEKLVSPSMEFEKRNDELIKKLSDHELAIRKEEAAKQEKVNALASEKASLKAHILNEHARIAATYRATIKSYVKDGYALALQNKLTGEQLTNHIASIKKFILAEPLPKFQKFNRLLVDDATALAMFSEVEAYNPAEDLNATLEALGAAFVMYEEDLQNAEAAIAQTKKESESEASSIKQELEVQQATNTLMASAESAQVVNPKAVVRSKVEVVEENNVAYATQVLALFLANFALASSYLKVRTWPNLSVKQMAVALGQLHNEHGVKLGTLKTKTIEK